MSKFVDILFTPDQLARVEITPRGKIVLLLQDGRIVILRKRALRQFKRFYDIGLSRNTKWIMERIREVGREVVISTTRFDGKYYAYRVTSTQYTPIPHSLLFNTVRDELKKLGADIWKEEFIKYSTMFANYYYLYHTEVEELNDRQFGGIVVMNANTGAHSIRVSAFVRQKSCGNIILYHPKLRTIHVGSIEDIQYRVRYIVGEVYTESKEFVEDTKMRLVSMSNLYLHLHELNEYLTWLEEKLPGRYKPTYRRVREEFLSRYSNTLLAIYNIYTYLFHYIGKTNLQLALDINRKANQLLLEVKS